MSRPKIFKEELELEQLRATELELLRRQKESAEIRKRLAHERSEREHTMPPLEEVQARARRIQHEINVSRGEVANLMRAQNRSLLLLLLLVTVTCTLVWWGVKLMQSG